MRRTLRQEVNFGCAICGCPIIEIHHIIPWAVAREHKLDNMIALCPTCAHRADMGEYSTNHLKDLKKNPHNLAMVKDAFSITTKDISVVLGGIKCNNVHRLLVVDEFDIISMSKEGNYPIFNINFFDEINNWIAIVYENEWCIDTSFIWDLEYKPKHLVIRCAPRKISLEIRIKDDIIYFKGNLFFNMYNIELTDAGVYFAGHRTSIQGFTVENPEDFKNITVFNIRTGLPLFSRPISSRTRVGLML